MSKYWQTDAFSALEEQWDAKLKKSGFVDAEKTVNKERVLIQNTPNAYRQAPQVTREAKEQYFTLVSYHMGYKPPRDRIERIIMHNLSFGARIGEICEQLKDLGGSCHRQTVRFIIRKYEHKWKIRRWSKEKLNPRWRSTRIK